MKWLTCQQRGTAIAVALNTVVAFYAYRLTHFTIDGEPTAAPNRLGWMQRLTVLATAVTIPQLVNHHMPTKVGLPFERVRFASIDSLKLTGWMVETDSAESRAAMVLVPGYAVSEVVMVPEARLFTDLGLVLMDFRGCCRLAGRATTLGAMEGRDETWRFRGRGNIGRMRRWRRGGHRCNCLRRWDA